MELTCKEKIALASSPDLSFENAVVLSVEEDNDILMHLAGNPCTPLYILIQLANHNDWQVRCGAAVNSHAPASLLEELALDKDWYVCKLAKDAMGANDLKKIIRGKFKRKFKRGFVI